MILITTDIYDAHANKLISYLEDENLKFFRLNLDKSSLEKTKITIENRNYKVKQNNNLFYSKDIRAIFCRRAYMELSVEEENNLDYKAKLWRNEWNKALTCIYTNFSDKIWVNSIDNIHKAENKFRQLNLAKQIKFKIPDYIISNNKYDLENFIDKYESAIIKSMYQGIYKDQEEKVLGFYANKITKNHLKFLTEDDNPILIQNYIEKEYEVRLNYVDGNFLACKIESQKSNISSTDWRRYDLPNTPYKIIDVPYYIKNKTNKFMKHLNLRFGAFDFIVDNNFDWYFLEINPMGQYLWIEELTGLPITSSLKELLLKIQNHY